MLRVLALATTIVVAASTLAVAQGYDPHHPPPGAKPPPHGGPPPGPKPAFQPHGPGGPMAGPHGPGGPQFSYHGHPFTRVHLAPFIYPAGWGYRRWAIGVVLPPVFLAPAYYYTDWATLGLDPPQPGFQWVRYGPDLLLVDVNTGQVVDTVYDAVY
jgi:nickel/cobalt transporter regulator